MTEPLTPSDCDLRAYDWFPFEHKRFRQSAFWKRASDAACRISVELWSEAYQQVPCGSLPDDDVQLSEWAGFGRRDLSSWLAVKDEVMSAWVMCSDGRWYHEVLCEVARTEWAAELRRQAKAARRLEVSSYVWGELRLQVFVRDDYTCQYCGARGGRLECDHYVPVSKGGPTALPNLVTACLPCNRSKGSKLIAEWVGR